MAKMTTTQPTEHDNMIKKETVDIEYEPLPAQGQGQQIATVKAELDMTSVTTKHTDEDSIKDEVEVCPTEFLPQYYTLEVNNKAALRRECDRRYRDRHREKINRRRRDSRLNRKSLQPTESCSNVNSMHAIQYGDAASQQAEKDALRKARNRKYRESHREEINQRRKESRQRKRNV